LAQPWSEPHGTPLGDLARSNSGLGQAQQDVAVLLPDSIEPVTSSPDGALLAVDDQDPELDHVVIVLAHGTVQGVSTRVSAGDEDPPMGPHLW
jgi:hypothetical protein